MIPITNLVIAFVLFLVGVELMGIRKALERIAECSAHNHDVEGK